MGGAIFSTQGNLFKFYKHKYVINYLNFDLPKIAFYAPRRTLSEKVYSGFGLICASESLN